MSKTNLDARHRRLLHLTALLITLFLIVGSALFFWGILRAPALLARDDNPRLFEAERRIQRGAILDRNGVIFAQSSGPLNNLTRTYPVPAGDHAVGYYSFQYGVSGLEEGLDAVLRGTNNDAWQDFWRQQRKLTQVGEDVYTTLDAALQGTAVAQLNGRAGAILVLEKPQCANDESTCATQIRAMVSQPGYDANDIETKFDNLGADEDAPLLNRAAQGQYQPGLLLQPLILATAVEQNLIRLTDQVFDADRPILIGETLIRCATPPPEKTTWTDVLQHQCPGPMQELADQLGAGGLDTLFDAFGLTTDPSLPIRTETIPDNPMNDPVMAGIGQDNLSVTPLQIGLALSFLTGNGRVYPPQLINDQWSMVNDQLTIQAPQVRDINRLRILAGLPEQDGIHEHSVQVLSGPGGSMDSWYVGILPGETADTIIVVVLEGNQNQADAVTIGREMGTAVNRY